MIIAGFFMLIFLLFVRAGLKDIVDEVVAHSSLVCLIITSHSEHSLHPSLTEVQGSHFIQGFAHIQPPDQVNTYTYIGRLTGIVKKYKSYSLCVIVYRLREQTSSAI